MNLNPLVRTAREAALQFRAYDMGPQKDDEILYAALQKCSSTHDLAVLLLMLRDTKISKHDENDRWTSELGGFDVSGIQIGIALC